MLMIRIFCNSAFFNFLTAEEDAYDAGAQLVDVFENALA